jgi:prolyl 4-hydroxylase
MLAQDTITLSPFLECKKNPAFMHLHCAPVCFSCEMLHMETRCPMPDDPSMDSFQPGQLDKMFESILSDPSYQQYGPRALSRPTLALGDTLTTADYKVGGPWMVVFDKFVSELEADRLIELGGLEGYKRSEDVGEALADGTYTSVQSTGRTSTNAWCNGDCYRDPIARQVMDRISNVTGTPEKNSEYLQLLQYEVDQFYQSHNDYIEYQLDRPTGVRVLTLYIYLNDVEEGGGTNFPRADSKDPEFAVTPKKGRAALWPSVFTDRPNTKDRRTDDQALPVLKGVKYGANAWIHQRDFKTPNEIGC